LLRLDAFDPFPSRLFKQLSATMGLSSFYGLLVMKRILLAGAAALALLGSQAAIARVDVGISIGIPGIIIAEPDYYYPPVRYAPPPVVIIPDRHYHRRPVRVYEPRHYYNKKHYKHHHRNGPPGHRKHHHNGHKHHR